MSTHNYTPIQYLEFWRFFIFLIEHHKNDDVAKLNSNSLQFIWKKIYLLSTMSIINIYNQQYFTGNTFKIIQQVFQANTAFIATMSSKKINV